MEVVPLSRDQHLQMAQQGKPRGVRSRRLWSSQRAPGTSLWKLSTSTEAPKTTASATATTPAVAHLTESPTTIALSSPDAVATTTEAEQQWLTEMSQAIPVIPMPATDYRDLPAPEGSYTLTQAMDRYINTILPSAAAVQRLTSMETTTACTAMLQLIANDDLIRAGTLTYSLCSFPGALETGTNTHRDMIQARSELVDGIREIMPHGASDRLIYAMVFLMAVDSMLNYSDHARLHLKGLTTVLELRDGLEDLDRLPFGAGNLGDSVCGTFALAYSSMKIHDEPSEPSPHSSEMLSSEETVSQLDSLPTGFGRLGRSGKLSAAMINCLFDLQQIHLRDGVPGPSLFNRGFKLDLPLPWSSSFPQPRTRFERLIYITARTVAYDLCPTPNPIRMIFRDPRRYDEDLLDERIWTEENLPCLAWMITVINATLPYAMEASCRELLSRLVQRYPPARSWTLLSKVLDEFLVYSHLHVRWAQLWQGFYATQSTI